MISEATLERLAQDDPEGLLRMVRDNFVLNPTDTALALDVIARTLPTQDVRALLLEMVRHNHPTVRETALFKLSSYGHDHAVRDVIRAFLDPEHEPSDAVRAAAADATYLLDA